MKGLFIGIALIFFVSFLSNGQIISQFSWDSGPVTSADIGPDGTSASASAISDVGGVGGTNGLNAGLPKADVDMIIPGSPTFDIPGIDISFDYQREESQGNWWRRGNSLILDGTNNLAVSYRVDDGAGGYITVNSGNVYAIPNDDTYRNYRFYYIPSSGYGALLVDGVEVWNNDGPDNRDLYWTGAGDVTVCEGIDGTGFDDTFMDNLIVAEVIFSPLPIELLNFTATPKKSIAVELYWKTASELNNDFFTVERSKNGKDWEAISEAQGAGNSSVELEYTLLDEYPLKGKSYYRLKQTDFDGKYTYSNVAEVLFAGGDSPNNRQMEVYPNPVNEGSFFSLRIEGVSKEEDVQIVNARGQLLHVSKQLQGEEIIVDGSTLSKGMYFIYVYVSGEVVSDRILIK